MTIHGTPRLVPRRASSGISTSSPGSPPVTDLDVSLTAELKSHNASDGGIAILAKSLFDLVANAPGDDVTLKKADNHWAEIKERQGHVSHRRHARPRLPQGAGPPRGELRHRRERGGARDDRAHDVLDLQRRDPVSPQRRVLRERWLGVPDGVEARDNGDDGDACYDAGSIGVRCPASGVRRPQAGTGECAQAPGMYIGDTATAAACIISSRCSS
jgi:hypothetical protein